jgi:hypothetical protein
VLRRLADFLKRLPKPLFAFYFVVALALVAENNRCEDQIQDL